MLGHKLFLSGILPILFIFSISAKGADNCELGEGEVDLSGFEDYLKENTNWQRVSLSSLNDLHESVNKLAVKLNASDQEIEYFFDFDETLGRISSGPYRFLLTPEVTRDAKEEFDAAITSVKEKVHHHAMENIKDANDYSNNLRKFIVFSGFSYAEEEKDVTENIVKELISKESNVRVCSGLPLDYFRSAFLKQLTILPPSMVDSKEYYFQAASKLKAQTVMEKADRNAKLIVFIDNQKEAINNFENALRDIAISNYCKDTPWTRFFLLIHYTHFQDELENDGVNTIAKELQSWLESHPFL